ncbi:hypothetical protein L2E82_01318 [Cichorium intybus]|uniref:Uncharacterized protein n=1 Tax=Cichorium intybus TaxID=13427 RepID=A0ACB9GZC8_CICIN|nr:hypothetical protein L2E82_01318 [Cichorium intybus]
MASFVSSKQNFVVQQTRRKIWLSASKIKSGGLRSGSTFRFSSRVFVERSKETDNRDIVDLRVSFKGRFWCDGGKENERMQQCLSLGICRGDGVQRSGVGNLAVCRHLVVIDGFRMVTMAGRQQRVVVVKAAYGGIEW